MGPQKTFQGRSSILAGKIYNIGGDVHLVEQLQRGNMVLVQWQGEVDVHLVEQLQEGDDQEDQGGYKIHILRILLKAHMECSQCLNLCSWVELERNCRRGFSAYRNFQMSSWCFSDHSFPACTAFQQSQHYSLQAFQRSHLSTVQSIRSVFSVHSIPAVQRPTRIVHIVDFIAIGRQYSLVEVKQASISLVV